MTLYPGKWGGDRVQGVLTPEGAELFEGFREHLRAISPPTGPKPRPISDSDVIEWLLREHKAHQ